MKCSHGLQSRATGLGAQAFGIATDRFAINDMTLGQSINRYNRPSPLRMPT
jgi:hypothetical protein